MLCQRIVLGLLFVAVPGVVQAQPQESYLPRKTQLYFRWDGMDMHRAAFEKTAVGQMLKGDTGKFLDELWRFIGDQVENAAKNEPKVGPLLKDFGKLVSTMHNSGLVLGVSAETVHPPKVQAVIVFPKAAGESGTLIPLIQKVVEEAKAPAKSTKVGKRFVNHISMGEFNAGWWSQGEDAVIYLGTTDAVDYAKLVDGGQTGIAGNPLYVQVKEFKDFKTASRGYVDIASLLDVAAEIAPPAGRIIDELGLKGLKSVTFVSGFDGLAERSVVDVEMPSPRKGLLSLSSSKKISLKELPVLPNDITGFSASSINVNKTFDVLTNIVDNITRLFDPNLADNIKEQIKAFEGAVGVDISKDIFESFGEMMVTYSSPSDGILGTGAVVAIRVKDEKKLTKAIESLAKAIPANPAGQLEIIKKPYRSGQIMQLRLTGGQANSHLATIGTYKGWFIYSAYPQPIKGFIMRQEGDLPAWKADESLTKALAQFPKEFTSIKVSDPRPTAQTLISVLPTVMNLANTFGGLGAQFGVLQGFKAFDLDVIPHAQEATRHLFPNVTVTTDNGKRVRSETRASLALPF